MTNHSGPRSESDPKQPAANAPADEAQKDDPHKVEKLTKAGRDIDPNEGSD